MGILSNARHERFAKNIAQGKSNRDAYLAAGFKASNENSLDASASALLRSSKVSARIAELQGKAAQRAMVTIETIAGELEEARQIAIVEKQPGAAVSASMGKAKLFGLLIEKRSLQGPNGGPVEINLTGLTNEQLEAAAAIFGALAVSTGDNPESDQSGAGEAEG